MPEPVVQKKPGGAPYSLYTQDCGFVELWDRLEITPDGGDEHTWEALDTWEDVLELAEEVQVAFDDVSGGEPTDVTVRDSHGEIVYEGEPSMIPKAPDEKTAPAPSEARDDPEDEDGDTEDEER